MRAPCIALALVACGPGSAPSTSTPRPAATGSRAASTHHPRPSAATRPTVLLGACHAWKTEAKSAANPATSAAASVNKRVSPPKSGGSRLRVARRRPYPYYNTVQIQRPRVNGRVNHRRRYEIETTAGRRRSSLQSCYRTYLRSHPRGGGVVEVRYVIDAKGKVVQTSIAGFDDDVSRCTRQQIARIRFEPSAIGERLFVEQSIQFRPRYTARVDTKVRMVLGANDAELEAPSKRRCERRPVSLRGVQGDLERCFRRRLESSPKLAGRMLAILTTDGRGRVQQVSARGLSDRDLSKCAAEAIRAARVQLSAKSSTLACSVVFDNPEHSAVMADISSLSLSRGDIKLMARRVGETFDFHGDVSTAAAEKLRQELELRRFVVSHRRSYAGEPMPKRDHLALHAHPAVEVGTVANVLEQVREAHFRSIHFSRAVGASTTFWAVNPLGTPSWACWGARAPVSVWIGERSIAVSSARRSTRIVRKGRDHDFGRLRAALAELRPQTAGDLDIAAVGTVPYRVLASVVEQAVLVGYFDTRVVSPGQLAYRPR